ncbi:MAG: DUF4411 family protein [Spirochaetota bacterium]
MSQKYFPDANTFLAGWHIYYPPKVFARLWQELEKKTEEIAILQPIMKEIEPKSSNYGKLSDTKKEEHYPIRRWIEKTGFSIKQIGSEVEALSIELEKEYQIHEQSKGANQTDILLISYAKFHQGTVVTYEAKQPNRPGKKENYKIPLICKEQGVECLTFIEMITKLNIQIK